MNRSYRERKSDRAAQAALPWWAALVAVIVWCAAPLSADTLYQTSARRKQVVVHRESIVVEADASYIVYKHFELKDRRIVKVRLSRGSRNYTFTTSSPEERRQIVDKWRRFGYSGTITDISGTATRLDGLYLDFYPPGGRGSLLESVPPRTNLPVLIEGGPADEIEFSKISRIEFEGEVMTLSFKNGQVRRARFLMPTDKPAEARFLGITSEYDPASEDVFDFGVPLEKIKEVRFE